MRLRLQRVCHIWPGITPWNVWDLQWRDWVRFAEHADSWDRRDQAVAKALSTMTKGGARRHG